jgi:hypothetical protein
MALKRLLSDAWFAPEDAENALFAWCESVQFINGGAIIDHEAPRKGRFVAVEK